MRSLTRQEVRGVDACAINQLGIPGVILMENAGRNAADAIEFFVKRRSGNLVGMKIAIVAGAGNNGGDGFVIARHLANRRARPVTFLIAYEAKLQGDAAVNFKIICNLEHDIRRISSQAIASLSDDLKKFDLIIDSAGGTGIAGALRGDIAMAVEQINSAAQTRQIPVIAIDIPTGLDCDTGLPLGPAVRADMTVTFVARKIGFDNPASLEYTGQVIVADIGIDPETLPGLKIQSQKTQ